MNAIHELRSRAKSTGKETGFTLLEAIVSLSMMLVVMTAVVNTQVTALDASSTFLIRSDVQTNAPLITSFLVDNPERTIDIRSQGCGGTTHSEPGLSVSVSENYCFIATGNGQHFIARSTGVQSRGSLYTYMYDSVTGDYTSVG
ncbi:hypothetical protein [Leifsonia sp. NPDC080035]|uniref:Prepilin-type N-terminal cleavage/methylation domain-containing protein n=1 Tax=Leifsonia sp. NPDC080035 TaxID=3143936 RepID=A0AAU7GEM0_9MICO